MDKPLATTFYDDESVTVEILGHPSSTGLCKVQIKGTNNILVRNKVQLHPLNEAAKAILSAGVDGQVLLQGPKRDAG